MFVKKLKEAGYEEALLGLSLSFYDHKIPLLDWNNLGATTDSDSILEGCRMFDDGEFFWTDERYKKAQKVALHLATKEAPAEPEIRNNLAYISAEQKFLESIDVWVYIQASLDFWIEFDTYRVDLTKQSSSTMHTLAKRFVFPEDFEEGVRQEAIDNLNRCLDDYHDNESPYYHNITRLKKNLPTGWLQERVVKTSYKTLKWIVEQREGHRLEQWKTFVSEIMSQIEHPEFIKYLDNSKAM